MTGADRSESGIDRAVAAVDRSLFGRHLVRLALLGIVSAVVVWSIAALVFPHHTTNHDEGVYLQQAAMLLEGQLFLDPPVDGPFRPWFFVESDAGLYPKYAPPTAAVFAVGELLGGYRIALALVAAGCVVLTQVTVAEAFDARTGWVAAVLLLGSPLFLVQASVFLPYVPTLLWTLLFSAAYLTADRTGSRRLALLAGLAIGLAFFARPYTAVLFAAPFVVHALWTMRYFSRAVVLRQSLTAAGGLVGVVVALSYNAYITGEPLLFPYEAFAPLDGIGFGRREILGYSRGYTLELALRTTVETLWLLSTRWIVAGVVGTLAAVAGFLVAVRRGLDAQQAIVAGLVPSITIGLAYFWGPLNALGELGQPGDGLAGTLGPYYHVGLLLPVSAFTAVGLLAGIRWLRTVIVDRHDGRHRRRAVFAVTLGAIAIFLAAGGVAVAGPLADNADVSDRLDAAYEPFADDDYDDAVVFLPTPFGDWLNHPFQKLRNDPGYDDGPVYAMDDRQFDVIEAFPDRDYHRYTYRGIWSPTTGSDVDARIQNVTLTEGSRVSHRFVLGVPTYAEQVSFRLAGGGDGGYTAVAVENRSSVEPTVTIDDESTVLTVDDASATVPTGDRDGIELQAFVDYGTGAGYEYRIRVPIDTGGDGDAVRTLTPYVESCEDAFTCGGEAAYVPGTHPDYVAVDHEVTVDA